MGLRRFILMRVVSVVPILVGVSAITFALVNATPGDPVSLISNANPDFTAADEARLRARYGLDEPVWQRYFSWMVNVVQGDFGIVYATERSVSSVIVSRLPETVILGLFGWVFALLIAIPTGIYAAVKKDQLGDDVSRIVALSGISIPNFWLGLILILVFAVTLGWWSVLPPARSDLLSPEMLKFLILPGITIGTASAATLMRIMRSSMAEEMNKEYVTAARAKGLPERTVILKHVLRNSLISVTTAAAFLTAGIFSGAIVAEVIFSWPGLGLEFYNAILLREVNLILGITLFLAVILVLMNLLADIAYAFLDPRIRY
jgi:peptide/nickel transport system permease protein